LAAIVGFAAPYFFFGRFLTTNGLDMALLVDYLLANDISTFFAVDLVISALVFLVWSYREAQRVGMRHWWSFPVATLLVGPSFSFPLFLYYREARIQTQGRELLA
jgi:hypothetical protein